LLAQGNAARQRVQNRVNQRSPTDHFGHQTDS